MAAKTYDVGDDELETMDRTALLEVVAKDIVSPRGATSRRRSVKSDQVREMELQLVLKRMELESKRIEAETENRRREADTELESKRIEAENRARELQNEREKLRLADAAERGEQDGYDDQTVDEDGRELGCPRIEHRRPGVETLADRVKRYGSALKQVVSLCHQTLPKFLNFLKVWRRCSVYLKSRPICVQNCYCRFCL